MNTLQRALLPNGILAFTSGLAVIIMRNQLAEIFGITDPISLLTVGVVVSVFGLSVLLEVKMQRALATLWIIIQDALWAIGTIVLIAFQPFDLTPAAYWIIALYALPVVIFVWFQGHGLSSVDNKAGSTRKIFQFRKRIKADKSRTWEIISDLANYHEIAPNIDDTRVISGEGLGLVRQCFHGKDKWSERCILWNEGDEYSFEVDTGAPDYPYPLKYLKGTWRTVEINPMLTEIEMEFEFEYKKKIQNILIHPFMKARFTKVCKKLLDNWQEKIEG